MTVDLVLRLLEERDRWRSAFATVEAERDLYRAALNCERCKGWHRKLSSRMFRKPSGYVELEDYWEECPRCREAREKARMG